jgi:hypothetical protein
MRHIETKLRLYKQKTFRGNTMKFTKLIYFTDPGHGWMRVSKRELRYYNLLDKISGYSYETKAFAYLEEDCDLSLYRKARGVTWLSELEYTTKHTNSRSHVRCYKNYQKPVFNPCIVLCHVTESGCHETTLDRDQIRELFNSIPKEDTKKEARFATNYNLYQSIKEEV